MTAGRKRHNLEALTRTLGAIRRSNQKRESIGVLEPWGQQFYLAWWQDPQHLFWGMWRCSAPETTPDCESNVHLSFANLINTYSHVRDLLTGSSYATTPSSQSFHLYTNLTTSFLGPYRLTRLSHTLRPIFFKYSLYTAGPSQVEKRHHNMRPQHHPVPPDGATARIHAPCFRSTREGTNQPRFRARPRPFDMPLT